MMNRTLLTNAHNRSFAHRAEVEQSDFCRCFCCLATFPPAEIAEWFGEEGGETAVCPRCDIDSVIGSASGVDMSDAFFEGMRLYWFG